VRLFPILGLSSVVAACTTVLGIDGNYTSISDVPGAGGHSGTLDAAAAGRAPMQSPPLAAGGTNASGGYPNELPPPPFQSAGGTPAPRHEPDAGPKTCPIGQKPCGGVCVPKDASYGCATAACTPCMVTDPNAHAICDEAGACNVACNAGLVRNVDHCERHVDAGAGGATGSGGTGSGGSGSGGNPGNGGTGTGGRGGMCNPLACPTCSRGFEGCCIPAVPGIPSHCGCFYFPPLCTQDVG
jgi:hypothetical protein